MSESEEIIESTAEENYPSEWNLSEEGKRNIAHAKTEQKLEHGLYAGIPMICLNEKCPYKETCGYYKNDNAPEGERCPKEIAKVLNLYEKYKKQLKLTEDDMVQLSLLKEVIDLDIKIDRADRKQAADPDLIKEVPVAVSDSGRVIRKPEVDKVAELKDRLLDRRHKILSYLNATPKDKSSKKLEISQDPSTYAAQLLKKKKEIEESKTVEIEAEDNGETED
jgi:hypothetical protein